MKIQARNVVGKTQELTVEPSTTVSEVKDMLQNEYERQSLRLCLQGAVLEDAKTMEDCHVEEGTVLILAGRKRAIPKSTVPVPTATEEPKAEVAAVSADTQPSAPAEPVVQPSVNTSAPAVTADPSPSVVAPPPASQTPAAVPRPTGVPEVSEGLIDNLVSMGFDDREQVARALRAAYMNPDRAVDYLLSGIPPGLEAELGGPVATAAPTAGTEASASSAQPSDLRSMLFTIPRFDDIRRTFQSDSSAMETIMSQIAARYPHIYAEIETHPDEFLAIMAETGGPATVGPAAAEDDSSAEHLLEQMPAQLELTAADREAVSNLVAIGGGMWDAQAALLVYLATQRNTEVAAGVLFEHGGVPPELVQAIAEQLGEEEEEGDDDDDANYDDEEGN